MECYRRKCVKERKEAPTVLNAIEGTSQIKTETGPFEFISRKSDDQKEIFTMVQVEEESWLGRL